MAELLKGKYVLDACIGRGGMAEVFAGRTVGAAGFSQRVAIKRIHAVHGLDPQFRTMFAAEAQLSAYLRHSNVVRVFDFDEDEAGCLFLVMEYVDGIDLHGLAGTGPLPLEVILFVTGEILRGLAYVHELPLASGGPRGLVHRDVSPQNVLLSWDGAVQISDFGIAKARIATQAGASVTIKGKPAYMSPEQVRGLPLDGRSDVFAVGIMLWEMLCMEPLFHDPDDLRATFAAVMFGDVPPPSSCAPRLVPADVEHAAMRMLRRDREERYDAAGALAALTACADYPRSGREALAALLAERLPERAARRGSVPRSGRSEPASAPQARERSVEADPAATALAEPGDGDRARAIPERGAGSMIRRARRRGRRKVLLGAAMIGALAGATLGVVVGGHASPAPRAETGARTGSGPESGPPASPGVPQMPRTEPPLLPFAGAGSAPLQRPERPERPEQRATSRPDGGSTQVRPGRAPAPAPIRPPASGGMRIIDLRTEAGEPAPPAGGRRGPGTLELGPASE